MKKFFHSRDAASKGAALMIVLALVVLLAGVALAYFSRTTTDRQLAQSSYNDTSADILARSALDIVVGDFKQEILSHPTPACSPFPCSQYYITPVPYTPPPQLAGTPIANLIRQSFFGDPTGRTSNVNSGTASANGRSISTTRWNSHYLVPRGNPSDPNVNPSPTPTFVAPDWVLITAQGPARTPSPNAVIGRYAFAVYDEGGLLDMNLAGYPGWSGLPSGTCDPGPTPWLLNVGRKGIAAFADLTALPPTPGATFPPQQIDNIVGWRNYATTQRTFAGFPNPNPSPIFGGDTDCSKQDNYGSYLLYFGDPPFTIESLADKLAASLYPFTSVASQTDSSNSRTDQRLITRQQLLKLRSSLGFSQNVLQYMGTFSRERNWPAPDWPNLNGDVSEGRFNMNNLGLVIPNPVQCNALKGKKTGWYKGKNRNKLCGTVSQITELFGLRWVPSPDGKISGYWKYVDHTGPNPPGGPDPDPHSIICFRGANNQNDFFRILHYALNVMRGEATRCPGIGTQPRTFAIGASLIDQYDDGGLGPGGGCEGFTQWGNVARQPAGCDLDVGVTKVIYATHTCVIRFGQGGIGSSTFAFGMEPDYDPNPNTNPTQDGDRPYDFHDDTKPHRPCGSSRGGDCAPGQGPAPAPNSSTYVMNHAFSNVGEMGYGIDTSGVTGPNPLPSPVPLLKFWDPTNNPPRYPFQDAPVLDFFSYNAISSAYPRAGIVNLYTKNKEVIAAMLKSALQKDSLAPAPTPVVSQADAMNAAAAIVAETQRVLAGSPTYGSVQQTDLTRAIAGRLAKAAADAVSSLNTTDETRNTVARALAEMGQTRTWNMLIDVVAQTGKYKPNSDLTGSNFVVEGEKRYWLHIALGRDLICPDGTPYRANDATSCSLSQATVDVLGTQLEEVIE